jgi:hypothetical protein
VPRRSSPCVGAGRVVVVLVAAALLSGCNAGKDRPQGAACYVPTVVPKGWTMHVGKVKHTPSPDYALWMHASRRKGVTALRLPPGSGVKGFIFSIVEPDTNRDSDTLSEVARSSPPNGSWLHPAAVTVDGWGIRQKELDTFANRIRRGGFDTAATPPAGMFLQTSRKSRHKKERTDCAVELVPQHRSVATPFNTARQTDNVVVTLTRLGESDVERLASRDAKPIDVGWARGFKDLSHDIRVRVREGVVGLHFPSSWSPTDSRVLAIARSVRPIPAFPTNTVDVPTAGREFGWSAGIFFEL